MRIEFHVNLLNGGEAMKGVFDLQKQLTLDHLHV